MKITIEAVRPVARPGYKDVLWSGSAKREVDAPVLQFYEMTVTAEDGITRTFETEIWKSCGDGKQVDWSEHLDDFLGTIPGLNDRNLFMETIATVHYDVYEGHPHPSYYGFNASPLHKNTEQCGERGRD